MESVSWLDGKLVVGFLPYFLVDSFLLAVLGVFGFVSGQYGSDNSEQAMSQSASLYRVPESYFVELQNANGETSFDVDSASGRETFEGSHCGLEYLLSKVYPSSSELISEIFGPKAEIGKGVNGRDFHDLFEAYEDESIIPFIPPVKVGELEKLICPLEERKFIENFDPIEMNEAGIYPRIWRRGKISDEAFNERHLIEDFRLLKKIIGDAHKNNEYLFVFVG